METYLIDALIVGLAILIVFCYCSQAKLNADLEKRVAFNRHVKDALSIANRK